jgi:acyl transferase domain-containing protein
MILIMQLCYHQMAGKHIKLMKNKTTYLTHCRCKTFCEQADGYGRAEGIGLVVLLPLATALIKNLSVLGVVRGSAMTSNGRSNGITAPSQVWKGARA